MSSTRMERVLQVKPLFTITEERFMRQYRSGLWWAMYGEGQGKGAYNDTYLVGNIKKDVAGCHFNLADAWYRAHLGFYFGMIHGGILSPATGLVWPEASMLMDLIHTESQRGYNVGRRAFFRELTKEDRLYTQARVMEELGELVEENEEVFTAEDDSLIYWCLASLTGTLSGQVFPMTAEEETRWKQEDAYWEARIQAQDRQQATEPLRVFNVLQEA